MKISEKRALAMILCVLAVFSLFPVTADAAGTYGALSSKNVRIKYPAEFVDTVMTAKLKGGEKGKDKNGVYMVPRPETGNGDLGTVKNGSRAVILAEEGDYYFWMTTTGKLGWSNKKYFTEPQKVYSGYLFGDSGLTVDDISAVQSFILKGNCGYSSDEYYSSRAVMVVKTGTKAKITICGQFKKWHEINATIWGRYFTGKWATARSVNGTMSYTITGKTRGTGTITFTDTETNKFFNVLILVL